MSSEYDNQSDLESDENESDLEDHKSGSDSEGSATRLEQDFTTKIFTTLQQVKTPNAFAYSVTDLSLPNPGLYVPPHGLLGLPLWPGHARFIISQARQSLCGGGEERLVDTTVRKSWELNPSQFSIKNPAWKKAIKNIVDTVSTELGLPKETGKVSVELHKLVLYEPGVFFTEHKDVERVPGTFATLVVCLPSPHEGGKLVITNDIEKYVFETGSFSSFSCSYAAWYSGITHKVLPVVSGYRLVLTYNLIQQADFELPSYDLVRGHVKQLSTLLEKYNSRLEEGDNKLPPFLLHKLKHKYSQANLKLETLEPPDFAQVQVLKQLSIELGFNIYFGTLVLRVWKGVGYDEEEVRSQALENVIELDGTFVVKDLDCPDSALIDPTGQNEDRADEEKHESSSEYGGSSVTYYYRDTVVVLVPPSKQLDFICKFKSDGSVIEPLFNKRMQELSGDPAQKPNLERLCELTLKRIPTEYYYSDRQYSMSIPPYFQQAVTSALDLGRIDLFDDACKTTEDEILLTNAGALGRWAAKTGVAATTDRLMKGVRVASSIAKKVKFLKAIANGFETAGQEPNSAEQVSLRQWSDEAILTAVAELRTTTIRKDDAKSLARLCETSLFESEVMPMILKAVTMIKITFIDELMSALQLNEEQRLFVEMIIRNIWNQFSFESNCCKSVSGSPYFLPFWRESWCDLSYPVNENDLIVKDIFHIVETTVTVLSPECVEKTIISAMLTAIPIASKERTIGVFISLVRMILKNELAGFRLPNDSVPPSSHKRLIQALLTKFISDYVSPEPETPTDWSLRTRSCACRDCSVVNKFLRDPCELSLDFPCAEPRRRHLIDIFTDSQRLNITEYSGPSYDISIIRGTSPNIWRITKNRRGYETAKSEWIESTKSAKLTLSKLKSEEPVSGRLEAYLEPYYSVIMNAQVKELPNLKSLITMPQLSENNENAASALNQPAYQTGYKRGAGDIPEDELAKRSRS